MKIKVDYPSAQEEKQIMERAYSGEGDAIAGIVDFHHIHEAAEIMKAIHMEERIMDYIVEIVRATRTPGKLDGEISSMISYGASPRASIWLGLAARAHAFLSGRGYVTPAGREIDGARHIATPDHSEL